MQRERVRHEMEFRHATVSATTSIAPTLRRVTLTGESLATVQDAGPSDHVKVYFPDPDTGVLTAPTMGPEGVVRPTEGTVISRDFTPLELRRETASGRPELDLEFVLHEGPGPASAWAAQASVGDELVIGGPRGSALVPSGCQTAVLLADDTALPAMRRWIRMLDESVRITAICQVNDEDLDQYFSDVRRKRFSVEWLYRMDGPGQLDEAVRSLGPLDETTYVWGAGDATELVPVRRHLRQTLGLGRDQVALEGYWKRGVMNRDHHEPLDPTDPD